MAAQRLVWRFSNCPMVKVDQRAPQTASLYSATGKEMSLSLKSTASASAANCTAISRKLPILLFDIMDTVIRDPFYHDVPAFFGLLFIGMCDEGQVQAGKNMKNAYLFENIFCMRMSMKELLECKHPTAWIEFEKGLINEMELAQTFFKDGRSIDLEGLKSTMRRGYSYIEGVEELLGDLKKMGYEKHASTNYPIWYELIEEKLKVSTYLSWTFCSCDMGKRKPNPEFYLDVLKQLKVEPTCCVFIDDRMRNVEAALDAGFIGIQFKNVDSLRNDLSHLGINMQSKKWTENSDVTDCLQ